MSITDELRHLANEAVAREEYMYELPSELISIADRIDVMMEDCIELPKDADWQTIRIGDILDPPTDCPDYSPLQVMRLTFDGYEDKWFFDGESGGFTGMTGVHMDVAGWTHQSDSWERIIRDAQGDGILNQIDGRPSDFDALVERCKRLAGEGV